MAEDMGKLINIRLLSPVSIFVLTICFSIIVITYSIVDLAKTAERAPEKLSSSLAAPAPKNIFYKNGLKKEGRGGKPDKRK